MKNDGLAGAVIRDPVIAACADGVTTRPPTASTPASAVATLILAGPMGASSQRCARLLQRRNGAPAGAPLEFGYADYRLRAAGVRPAVAARVAAAGADHPPAAAGAL